MATTLSDPRRPWPRSAGWIAAALVTVGLIVLAARADLAPGGIGAAATVADLAVGLAFVGGAALATGPWRCRALFAAVGFAWLVGSFVPAARLAYLGVLATALATFPSGRPGTARDLGLVALSLLALVLAPPKAVLAALFATVAATRWTDRRWERVAVVFPVGASAAVAAVLAVSWLIETTLPEAFDPQLWRLVNEIVLFAIAAGLPVASGAVIRERTALADRLLGDQRVVGLDGLAVLLAEMLRDPRLRIHRWSSRAGAYVRQDGVTAGFDGGDAPPLEVTSGGERLAALTHSSTPTMNDPAIAAAVVEAVRLTALNERWQAAQRAQLAELEAARGRLLAATDRQRAATAARLRDEVVGTIEAAATELRGADRAAWDAAAREALEVAGRELDASAAEILALTRGVPPVELGDGRLADALEQLADRCPIPVAIDAAADATTSPEREAALFYVCSEAIANASKHARASHVAIDLIREQGDIVMIVADDGVGGADLAGSGLRGLVDRLAVYGGRLHVDSRPGAGTTLTARIPA